MTSTPRSPARRYDRALLALACQDRRQGLATREDLSSAGVTPALVSRALARRDLVRIRRGVYALAPLPVRARHLLRDGVLDLAYLAEVRAVLTSLGAVADRRTAALLWRLDLLVEPSTVECRVPRSQTRVDMKGVSVRCSRATAQVERAVAGTAAVDVTPADETVLDCALSRPLLEAVVIADSALRVGCVTVEELVAAVARRQGPGTRRLRRVLELMDPQSGSVLESMLRFLLLTNGLAPQSQYTVRRGTQVIGRFDFCFEAERLIVECDGRRWHDPDDVRRKDRHRDNGLQRLGWRILRFDWDEVRSSPAYVLAAVRDCLSLAQPVAA